MHYLSTCGQPYSAGNEAGNGRDDGTTRLEVTMCLESGLWCICHATSDDLCSVHCRQTSDAAMAPQGQSCQVHDRCIPGAYQLHTSCTLTVSTIWCHFYGLRILAPPEYLV